MSSTPQLKFDKEASPGATQRVWWYFYATLGKWNTEPIYIERKKDSKLVNFRYYMVPKINNGNFQKDPNYLEEIWAQIPVQKSEYGMPILNISKKEVTETF